LQIGHRLFADLNFEEEKEQYEEIHEWAKKGRKERKKGRERDTSSLPLSQPVMASFSNMCPQEVMVGSFIISRVMGHKNSFGTLGRSPGDAAAAAAAATAATAAAFAFLSILTRDLGKEGRKEGRKRMRRKKDLWKAG
jgi:hypothetical protein